MLPIIIQKREKVKKKVHLKKHQSFIPLMFQSS